MPSECTEYFGIVFDLDDTLISTSPVYYKCFAQMLVMLYEDTGVHFVTPEEVIDTYDTICSVGSKKWEIDHITTPGMRAMSFEELEINSSRDISDFPRKLVDTYIECCLMAKTQPNRDTAVKVHMMANSKLSRVSNYPFMPGAVQLLRNLISRQNVVLFLITAGPEQLQRPKIETRTIFKHFAKIRVVPRVEDVHAGGKGVVIKEWMQEFSNINHWITVGDSIPIDINPSLAAGCTAIHVTDNQCHLAKGKLIAVPGIKERYIHADDMGDVYNILVKGLLNAKSEVSFQERTRSICDTQRSFS